MTFIFAKRKEGTAALCPKDRSPLSKRLGRVVLLGCSPGLLRSGLCAHRGCHTQDTRHTGAAVLRGARAAAAGVRRDPPLYPVLASPWLCPQARPGTVPLPHIAGHGSARHGSTAVFICASA